MIRAGRSFHYAMKRFHTTSLRFLKILIALFAIAAMPSKFAAAAEKDFHSWAASPPMGWNSWDCFGTTVTEEQTKQQADFMAEKLKSHGWQYIVVDIQWYQPTSKGHDYQPGAKLTMDEFSRLLPAVEKFPSATNGQGFRPLADYIHSKGLKFGIHMMRGIPRQAVFQNTAIKGTSARAADIADTNSVCAWNPDMFGVDMKRPGAQAYYDSLFELVASWGVDFVKIDDLSRPYNAFQRAETEAIRQAIDRTGRAIVFSTSPGETPLKHGSHISQHANMWRISDDFWDAWPQLKSQFKRVHDWTPYRIPGAWPDADMLPFGIIRFNHQTGFTRDEQITVMTLWSMARSPLMHGGDMTKTDDFTLSLLTNDEVLAVNQHSENNRQLFRTEDGFVAWIADVPESSAKYLAVFNLRDATNAPSAMVPVKLADLKLSGEVQVRDLWQHRDLENVRAEFSPEVPSHGARLFRLTPVKTSNNEH